jgi:hypothetical protein
MATATHPAGCHNPSARSSGKRAIPLAAKVARELGVIPTWPNLQTIRLALESEATHYKATFAEIGEMFIRAGKEWTDPPIYHCPSQWERREISRVNTVDRFWFEDARWRYKLAYAEFLERRKELEPRAC